MWVAVGEERGITSSTENDSLWHGGDKRRMRGREDESEKLIYWQSFQPAQIG